MKFWLILLGALIFLGLGGFLILANLHNGESLTTSQKEKALTNLLGRAPITMPTDHSSWKTYTSPVMTFDYPGWATINTADNVAAKKNAGNLDSFHFTLRDEHITGTVAVAMLSISTLSEDSGVHIRLTDPAYTQVGTISATTVAFLNVSLEERSLFTLLQGKEYTIVVSGGGDEENKEIFEKISNSIIIR